VYFDGVSELREKLHESLTVSGATFVAQEKSRLDARLESSVSEHDDEHKDDEVISSKSVAAARQSMLALTLEL
jgi:hypothetical protein